MKASEAGVHWVPRYSKDDRDGLQRCIICGRLFIRRPEKVCSRDCLSKLTARSSVPSSSQ